MINSMIRKSAIEFLHDIKINCCLIRKIITESQKCTKSSKKAQIQILKALTMALTSSTVE